MQNDGASTAAAAAAAPQRELERATAGTKHTLDKIGKMGGDFTLEKNPAFIKKRRAVFEEVKIAANARAANLPKEKISVTLPNGKTFEGVSNETTPFEIAKGISNSLAKKAIVAHVKFTGKRYGDSAKVVHAEAEMMEADAADIDLTDASYELWDMTRPLDGDCKLKIIKFNGNRDANGDEDEAADKLGESVFWHSSAHVLGQAIENEFGGKLTIGPSLKEGFYYDAYIGDNVVTEEKWYSVLQKATAAIVKSKQTFERAVLTKDEARRLFQDNNFKLAIINSKVPDGSSTTVYRNGDFIDLCMGPHLPNTSVIKAVKFYKHSAAYFAGKVGNDDLQRVYGVSFPDKKQLKKWEKNRERMQALDHRNIGPHQDLFFFHELSRGSCFFLPMGTRIYRGLITYIKEEYRKRGYTEVITPNIFNTDLWKISGHYKHYLEDMFIFKTGEGQEFGLKPMNCPGHCLMFRSKMKSYRDLPLRLADFGALHRNEASGALGGLTRVRRFQQDDAHIFCRPNQVQEEVLGALDFMQSVYGVLGMKFKLFRSTRPEKAIGIDTAEGSKRWDIAENDLAKALDMFTAKHKLAQWRDDVGGGAFYGPKIDIKVFDCMGREHQCATVQLDFQLPIRFDLQYRSEVTVVKGDTGEKAPDNGGCTYVFKNLPNSKAEPTPGFERPVMVHRAMLGSVERMFAILTEHFAGNWPLWLSPRQVMVIPIHKTVFDYCDKVAADLRAAGFYAESDLGSEKYQKKIAVAQSHRWNYILVVGQTDIGNGTVGVRQRNFGFNTRDVKVEDLIARLRAECASRELPAEPSAEMLAKRAAMKNKNKKGGKGGGKPAKKKGGGGAYTGPLIAKVDIRVGKIVKAWPHPDSDKLWCEEIDVGEEKTRQIASGLRKHYTQDEMQGRLALVVCNLKVAKLGGFASHGMVLCAKKNVGADGTEEKVEFVDPPKDAKIGERIFIAEVAGALPDPFSPAAMKKKKYFRTLAAKLKTAASALPDTTSFVANWDGKPLMTSAGPCTAPTLGDAKIE